MIALYLIVIGLWLIVCTFAVLLVRGGNKKPTPSMSDEQMQWFKAAAKVASRRHTA